MATIRVIYNTILVKLGIRQILPIDVIKKIKIKDCKEQLIPFPSDSFVIKTGEPITFLRSGALKRLTMVNEELKQNGMELIIYEGYRSKAKQKAMWDEEKKSIMLDHPSLSEEEIRKLLSKRIANPKGFGGHQTGGAVDVGLISDGHLIDVGGNYLDFNKNTYTNNFKELTIDQKANRNLLTKTMKKYGFINFPAEWWHYSYGDIMWAAYGSHKLAIYDAIDFEKESNL